MKAQPGSFRYWAFISYSSADKAWARWLQRAIESYGIPARLVHQSGRAGEPVPKRLRPVFRDRAELPASASLGAEIADALLASRFLIVICSPSGARSGWVNKEVESFQRLGRRSQVLALIVDGEPHSGGETECFPAALGEADPAAADVRPGHESKNDAKLKLLAGMLGIGFDALKQRDARRRIRRLQVGIGVVLALALSFAGLALYAEHERDKAVKSRSEAESLVGYMMYDLTNKLKPLERWDIVRATQERVNAYYAQMGVEEGGLGALRNQGQGMCNEGLVLEEENDLEAALARYREALATFEELASSYPDDGLLQSDLSWTHGLIAGVLGSLGDLDAALLEDRQALAIDKRLTASYPGDAFFQKRLALSHYELGTMLTVGGDLDEAMLELQEAQAVVEAHAETAVVSDPNEAEWQRLSSVIHTNMGLVLEVQGDPDGALREYQEALALMQPLTKLDPGNLTGQWELAKCHNDVARALEGQADFEAATSEYQAALAILEPLIALDSTKTEWQLLSFFIHNHLGQEMETEGERSAALLEYRAALGILEHLVASDPANADWQGQAAQTHLSVGRVLEQQDDLRGAALEYGATLTILEVLVTSDPDNTDWQGLLTVTQASLKRVLALQ